MKVLFTFPGLAHYLSALLTHLQEDEGLEIGAIIPAGKSESRGAGVHITDQITIFKTIKGIEKKGIVGKPVFQNLPEILEEEKPDILVIGWPYALDLIFNFKLRKSIKKNKIKLIYKGIPFNLPANNQIKSFYYSNKYTGGEGESLTKSNIGFLKFYFITKLRGLYLKMVDAHVFYIDESVAIAESYGVAKEKVFITYNSPDTDTHLAINKKLHEIKPKNPTLLHVGRLVKWKRVDLLIDSYRILKQKHPLLELIIVGNGPEENELRKYAFNDQSIKFKGAVYDSIKLGEIFKQSSIYVLAGMGGLSINEAMCYGLPVICSVADGTEKAMVREGVNGFYFERDNLESLVSSIDLLIGDAKKCEEFGEQSLKIIEEEINIQTVCKRYVNAFNFVLKN